MTSTPRDPRIEQLVAAYDHPSVTKRQRKGMGRDAAAEVLRMTGLEFVEFSEWHFGVKAHGAIWNFWPSSGKWSFAVRWESSPVRKGLGALLADIDDYGRTKAVADEKRAAEDDKRARYRRAWERWGEADTHEERIELEMEMDRAQNEFTREEWEEFRRTIPGFTTVWSDMAQRCLEAIEKTS